MDTGNSKIKTAVGYLTDDGKMFLTLDEAAEHKYGKALKAALGGVSGVFGVNKVLQHSREVEVVLRGYNQELDRLDEESKG